MNKLAKGSLAAAAGTILLLGGAGTFMSWNADATITGGAVAAGHLRLLPSEGPATWEVNEQKVEDISAFRIVPGDVVEYTTLVKLEAEGDNLTASLELTDAAITATPGDWASEALSAHLEKEAMLELTPESNRITSNADGTYAINAGSGTIVEDVLVSVRLEFPFAAGTATDEDAMNGSVDISDMSVKLTQTNTNNPQ
ncbi:hypothetical protein COCCU_12780 [Corynebacterium occultum]|uniref:Alternate signal-mediated exported protein, RER_14450 family n=1 Tax=Corynebacterium occultum TaxID=2675219 RepID=A0A6B8WC58_9CORY|nr:alternate-type signal peptide domain-containing protein [Corynebacterium occultum]QGU08456.1 hypothetical protein COCCU_12780 [Corynebacterium occultum]